MSFKRFYYKQKYIGNYSYSIDKNDENLVHIWTINIFPRYQGQGYGSQILDKIISENIGKKFQALILGGLENISSIKLFSKYNFKIMKYGDEIYAYR